MNLVDYSENFLNEGTSHGLVSVTVPSFSHAFIRS
uniref:Uncharacterized protein n=1 Tax=Rhizophora mucronata TaxID=61149 RepID=A0A2P2IWG9_RHIMU